MWEERREEDLERFKIETESRQNLYNLLNAYATRDLVRSGTMFFTDMKARSLAEVIRRKGGGSLSKEEKEAVVLDLAQTIAGKSKKQA